MSNLQRWEGVERKLGLVVVHEEALEVGLVIWREGGGGRRGGVGDQNVSHLCTKWRSGSDISRVRGELGPTFHQKAVWHRRLSYEQEKTSDVSRLNPAPLCHARRDLPALKLKKSKVTLIYFRMIYWYEIELKNTLCFRLLCNIFLRWCNGKRKKC